MKKKKNLNRTNKQNDSQEQNDFLIKQTGRQIFKLTNNKANRQTINIQTDNQTYRQTIKQTD